MKSLSFSNHFLSICILITALSSLANAHVVLNGHNRKSTKRHVSVNPSKNFRGQLQSRGNRLNATGRNLGRKFINGTTLGVGALGAGAYLALKDRMDQGKKVKVMNAGLKAIINRYTVLREQNRGFYREVDEELTKLEEKVEDLADTATQRISDFDIHIRAKINGKAYIPHMSF